MHHLQNPNAFQDDRLENDKCVFSRFLPLYLNKFFEAERRFIMLLRWFSKSRS